jgi:hypothetical protein
VPISPGDRIDLLHECAELMANRKWADIDLILSVHDAPTSDFWQGDDKRSYAIEMLKNTTDTVLTGVHDYLTRRSDSSRPGQSPWSTNRLRLFCSHLAAHRADVGEVAQCLDAYGVDSFVAHDSIEPSKEWQQVIEAGLREAEAMVVFLHPQIIESKWCDQEIGWAVGRNIPILPLEYGMHPYGFLGKYQDLPCTGRHSWAVAQQIADWASKMPTLQARMATSLSYAFENARSYDHTRSLATMLERLPALSEDELQAIERGLAENRQVYECVINGQPAVDWVKAYVGARRTPTNPEPDPWSDEPPF